MIIRKHAGERKYSGNVWRIYVGFLCAGAASLLLIAAFVGHKSSDSQWVPLNEAVQARLDEMSDVPGTVSVSKSAGAGIDKLASGEEIGEGDSNNGVAGQPISPEGIVGAVELGSNPDSGAAAAEAFGSYTADGRLDLNKASAAELESLKGIGPSKALAIVDDRQRNGNFRSVEDLLRVKGIGEKVLAAIKESVVANR